MYNLVDFSGRPFHFIGVGGIGMSALAYVLAKRNLPVSGSDTRLSHITQRLQDAGVHVFLNQDSSNLQFFQSSEALLEPVSIGLATEGRLVEVGQDRLLKPAKAQSDDRVSKSPQIVCSTAIRSTNSEYQAALEQGYPIFHRSDLLAALIKTHQSIAVAGTHGKTTTSSLIGHLLLEAGLDPTIVVGGEVTTWGGNAYLGSGPHLVAEADESDGSLVKFSPYIGVITNIELDHPDHYHSLEEVIQTFQTFTQQCQVVVACADCPNIQANFHPNITYSLSKSSGATYTVDDIRYGFDGSEARVWENDQVLGQLNLRLRGSHNLSNALAVVAVGRFLGLSFSTIHQALKTFEGARRRFEHRGTANNITLIDDYAHHPSEIKATLAAAHLSLTQVEKSKTKGNFEANLQGIGVKRLVAIFQPHRYSRTMTFFEDFAESFKDADVVVLTDIYGAGEKNSEQITGQVLAEAVARKHPQVYYQPTLELLLQFLGELLNPGDLALFLGAGNINQIIPDVLARQQEYSVDS